MRELDARLRELLELFDELFLLADRVRVREVLFVEVFFLRSANVSPIYPLRYPPIGALGFAPQKTSVPIIPMMWTKTMFKTMDFAVAVPTPTGPPEAV